MYADLKRKVCNICNVKRILSEFPKLRKGAKEYRRPFCFDCKSEAHFRQDLWKHYRIRIDEYRALYDSQEGKCACCGQHESEFKRNLHVDHDHETGKIRGLLCTQCNPGIGYFQDSIERLEMAVQCLKKFKK